MTISYFKPSDPKNIETLANDIKSYSTSAQEYVKNVAAFLSIHLTPYRNTPYTTPMDGPEAVLLNGYADCGHKEWLFQTLLKVFKLECRRISFSNVPIQLGHTCTEVKIGGKWQFFDSSMGAFFTEPDGKVPLSIAEARFEFPKIDVWKTVQPIFSGYLEEGYDLRWTQSTEQTILDPEDGKPLTYLNEAYFLSNVIGAEIIAYDDTVVPVDLRTDDEFKLGIFQEGDRPLASVHGVRGGKFVPTMLERVGMFFDSNSRHKFILMTDEEKSVDIAIDVLRGTDTELYLTTEPVLSPEHSGYSDESSNYRKVVTEITKTSDRGINVKARIKILPPFTTLTVTAPWDEHRILGSYSFKVFNAEDAFWS